MAPFGGFTGDFDDPFFSGISTATTALVPGTYPVALNGHPYTLNMDPQAIESYGDAFKEMSLPLLRNQADQASRPGEASLSPAQFWRRSQDTWHGGAGQSMLDRDGSEVARFSTSKGVNPWTRYELSLLAATTNIRSTANTALVSLTAGSRYYVADGTTLASTADLSSFTATTGVPAAQATMLATNGDVLYAAYGASGVYSIAATVGTSYVTGTVDSVGYAKGRLLVGAGNALYNPVAAGALGTAIHTVPDTGWRWSAFTEGNAFIYAAGYVGTVSRVYRIAITPDGTALAPGIVAATLPTGERVRSIFGYLGYIVIGTDKGVRFATASASGDLTLGALIPTPAAVYCIDAADRFVWFGWSSFDSVSSGLGRLDLSVISDSLAPAYASDLMGTGLGAVRGTGLIGDRRLFTVDGIGTFAEATTSVSSGYVTSGQINYGISDPKVPVAVDLKHEPLPVGTSVTVELSSDRGAPSTLGSSTVTGSVSPTEALDAGARRAEEIELTVTLTAASGVGPVLTRWTLLAYPAPAGASSFMLPIWLAPMVLPLGTDAEYPMDVFAEYAFLRDLHDSREILIAQVGVDTFQGTLEEFTWLPERHLDDRSFWKGTFIATIRRIKG